MTKMSRSRKFRTLNAALIRQAQQAQAEQQSQRLRVKLDPIAKGVKIALYAQR